MRFHLNAGFYDECKRRYNVKLWKTFTDCFNCLPIAAIIDEKIFCCHGGLSPDLNVRGFGFSWWIQSFPGILKAVGHFIESFSSEMNLMSWDSIASLLDKSNRNFQAACPTRVPYSPNSIIWSSLPIRKNQRNVLQLWEPLDNPVMFRGY